MQKHSWRDYCIARSFVMSEEGDLYELIVVILCKTEIMLLYEENNCLKMIRVNRDFNQVIKYNYIITEKDFIVLFRNIIKKNLLSES